MESTTDFLLAHRARAGDEEACERLVRKYYPSIYQYCLLHIYDTYEAEDLTQEVFVRAFASLERYREYGKVKNYLYRSKLAKALTNTSCDRSSAS